MLALRLAEDGRGISNPRKNTSLALTMSPHPGVLDDDRLTHGLSRFGIHSERFPDPSARASVKQEARSAVNAFFASVGTDYNVVLIKACGREDRSHRRIKTQSMWLGEGTGQEKPEQRLIIL